MKATFFTLVALSLTACGVTQQPSAQTQQGSSLKTAIVVQDTDTAIFAGGCFWCVESDFEKLDGVIEVTSGYTGGSTDNPTYKQVSYTETGHYEAAKIVFDPQKVSYKDLLSYYWVHVDPTDDYGQFCDKGSSYRTAIFARADQLQAAEASKTEIENTKPFDEPIVTPVLTAQEFYEAEEYHQDYYKKNPLRYKLYRTGCGRDARLKELWGAK